MFKRQDKEGTKGKSPTIRLGDHEDHTIHTLANTKGRNMKALSWFNKTWVLALAVGLAGAACAAKQSNVVNKGELPPPQQTNSDIPC